MHLCFFPECDDEHIRGHDPDTRGPTVYIRLCLTTHQISNIKYQICAFGVSTLPGFVSRMQMSNANIFLIEGVITRFTRTHEGWHHRVNHSKHVIGTVDSVNASTKQNNSN